MNTWQKSTLVRFGEWIPQGGDGTVDDTSVEDDTTTDDTVDDANTDDDQGASGTVSKSDFEALQAKFNQMKAQLSAADKNKSDAQKRLEELTRKEKTDLENAQADAKKFEEQAVSWQERYTGLALTNAFLIESARNNITWHDPEVAQRAASLKDLTVDENDGSVEGMAAAVKALAKEKSFLVNSSSGTDTEDGKEKTTNGKSGSLVGSGSKNKGKPGQVSDEDLIKRFPALRR